MRGLALERLLQAGPRSGLVALQQLHAAAQHQRQGLGGPLAVERGDGPQRAGQVLGAHARTDQCQVGASVQPPGTSARRSGRRRDCIAAFLFMTVAPADFDDWQDRFDPVQATAPSRMQTARSPRALFRTPQRAQACMLSAVASGSCRSGTHRSKKFARKVIGCVFQPIVDGISG